LFVGEHICVGGWWRGDVGMFKLCIRGKKKMPNSSRITFYSKFKMSPLISNGRFVAEPDGGAGLVNAAQSHRKILPL